MSKNGLFRCRSILYFLLFAGYFGIFPANAFAGSGDDETAGREYRNEIGRGARKEAGGGVFRIDVELLSGAAMMPRLGIGVRLSPSCWLLFDGGYARWPLRRDRFYYRWSAAGELRFALRPGGRHSIGLYAEGGQYDIRSGARGRQGDYYGGGVVWNYECPLTRRLGFDFGIGVGYVQGPVTEYRRMVEGCYHATGKYRFRLAGPARAHAALVYRIGGGGRR